MKWEIVYITNLNPDVSSSCDKTELAVSESTEPNSTVCSSEEMDRVDLIVLTILSTEGEFVVSERKVRSPTTGACFE